ncbi:urease accessory protein UreF [Occultella kanbiaonis]|uniref:urease accessory protein UreF n=1 Tax=Occultella kanbiaonis TaxID=2675754 RepID=UPI0012B7AA7C|nr:urease accessory UreF family protein [Occultella kanbiaonis]
MGPSQSVLLALLADARLPTGAHTQSAGLEPALRSGLATDAVPAYLAARLRTVCVVEAGTAVVARHVSLAGGRTGDLAAVETAWAARTPSPALRANARMLGRGYVRLLHRLWPVAGDDPSWRATRPVVLGLIAARSGLDAANTARLVGYDDAQTVAAAMLKLAPLDPLATTSWVLTAWPLIETLADRVAHFTRPGEIPACGAPLIEQWAQDHDHTTERLFRA